MNDLLDLSLLPQQTTLFTVWLLGASLGLTACTATCLPFMGTWILGRGGSQMQALRDTALFVSGRILAYTMLGALAAAAGTWLSQLMQANACTVRSVETGGQCAALAARLLAQPNTVRTAGILAGRVRGGRQRATGHGQRRDVRIGRGAHTAADTITADQPAR